MLFETDFPHPTCQHPGPRTPAVGPETYAERALGSLPDDVLQKVLVDNAAALYGVAVRCVSSRLSASFDLRRHCAAGSPTRWVTRSAVISGGASYLGRILPGELGF